MSHPTPAFVIRIGGFDLRIKRRYCSGALLQLEQRVSRSVQQEALGWGHGSRSQLCLRSMSSQTQALKKVVLRVLGC